MARDVVDAAVADFDREVPGSVTDQVPLLGADGLAAVQPAVGRLAEDYGVPRAAVEHLLGRYGTLAAEVLDLVKADAALGRPLAAGHPYLRAEVAYAVSHEGALHVEDVLMRRTRLFIEAADSGAGGGRGGRDHGAAARLVPAAARGRDAPVPRPGRGRARRGPRWIPSRRPAWPSPRRDELAGRSAAADVPAGPGATAAAAGPPGARGPDDVRGRDARAATVRAGSVAPGGRPPGTPPVMGGCPPPHTPARLPERVAARLRELRSSGRSELLSGTLAALNEAGWPLRSLAEALGISRQAVQARVRRRAPGRPARPRGALRAAAAVPAATGGQPGRPAAAPDDQDRPHAARVGAPGRGRRGQLAHPGGGGDPGSLPQARHGGRGSGAAGGRPDRGLARRLAS